MYTKRTINSSREGGGEGTKRLKLSSVESCVRQSTCSANILEMTYASFYRQSFISRFSIPVVLYDLTNMYSALTMYLIGVRIC